MSGGAALANPPAGAPGSGSLWRRLTSGASADRGRPYFLFYVPAMTIIASPSSSFPGSSPSS